MTVDLSTASMVQVRVQCVEPKMSRTYRFEALSQMLLTNQRLDKLTAACVDFTDHGMLEGTCLSLVWDQILRMCFSYISNDFSN